MRKGQQQQLAPGAELRFQPATSGFRLVRHSLTHSLTHALTHSLTHQNNPPTHSLTRSHSLTIIAHRTHSLTHALTS
jgi:hypothetical protein